MSFVLRLPIVFVAACALSGTALAQTDYSAGKSAPQLFGSNCSACHRSPQGLANGRDARTLTGFLREHYTTKVESASLLATYLVGIGGRSPARAVQPTAESARGTPTPPDSAQPAQAAPGADTARAPRPPGATEGTVNNAVREPPKPGEAPGPKGKPGERPAAKPPAETVLTKLRGYATTGEEAKPPAPEASAPLPIRIPSDIDKPAPVTAPRSETSEAPASGGFAPPTAREPAAPPPAADERPKAPPPG
jgi:hypothetical protein